MALTWDITKCDRIPRDELPDVDGEPQIGPVTDEFWPIVERTIWRMMATGLGWSLTDENAAKFYARSNIYADLTGDERIEIEDVWKMVGLHVNVAPETDAKWRKRLFDFQTQMYEGRYKRVVAELNAANEANETED